MTIRRLVAAFHLLALGIGLGAVWARGRALRGPLDATGLRRAFYADTWWGIAAGLWIATGVARAFAVVLMVLAATAMARGYGTGT
jgi:uncharacterized membrane protein